MIQECKNPIAQQFIMDFCSSEAANRWLRKNMI